MKSWIAITIIFIYTNTVLAQPLVNCHSCNPSYQINLSNQHFMSDYVSHTASLEKNMILDNIWGCTKAIFQGAWDASFGMVADLGNAMAHPIQSARAARDAIRGIRSFLGDIVGNTSSLLADLREIPLEDKIEFLCNIIGGIAIDVIILILAKGASAGKLGITIQRITDKVADIVRMVKAAAFLPFKKLAKLTKEGIENMKQLLGLGYHRSVFQIMDSLCP